ncbi:Ankyrin [Plasmopara halstedii]|uniref:Ankyrin n=1 Tax=Plasmopara halstedii TaxID=4781 RepID=A0A0P1AAH9_PLAHL|nr:Ankyrin [Plasmopara halstedii]CEG37746.1 Ankyrin [Plasmopara halstedii]|eukprot:XP_024574115.1 Ankyrin [Plasmopara halstedii]
MSLRLKELGLSVDEIRCGKLEAKIPRDTITWTPLQYACAVGNVELASEILAENPEAVNELDNTNYAYSPLHIAVRYDHENIVKLLLSATSKSNAVDNQVGCTPLHLAVVQGNQKMVKLLLNDASIQQLKSKNGTTPIEIAEKLQLSEIQTLLIDHATRVAGQKQLSSWLASIGLVQYAPKLFDEGYDDAHFLLSTGGLDDATLNAMHIRKAGHRAKLQNLYQLKQFLNAESEEEASESEDNESQSNEKDSDEYESDESDISDDE